MLNLCFTEQNLGMVLGEKLEEAPTISEAINKSGLDWEVGVKDLVTTDGYDVPAKATIAKVDNSILRVVGPRYVPLLRTKMPSSGFSHS